MNILIVGGAGFIGTNLARKLLEDGHYVYILDDLSTGRLSNFSLLREEFGLKVSFWDVDITDFEYLKAVVKSYLPPVHQIYHLACPASPPKYQMDPIKTLDTNYIGTKNMLEIAKKSQATILFSSTSEVYGDPLEHPQKESYSGNVDPGCIRSVYDEGKRVAETLVSTYRRKYSLDTRIARIFNTYGPFMDPDDGRVVTNFIKNLLNNEPVLLQMYGEQTRSFCYVDDLVEGLILLMNHNGYSYGPVNVGNPDEIKIKNLASLIGKILKLDSVPVEHCPPPPGDPRRRQPDISMMRAIGWEPKTSLQDGLEKTIEYMKKELGK
jgi:UDP-glucuronate decarboxylase